jgi:hypothetical protein
MKRLVTALAGVGLMLALTPPALAPAAVNNATSLTPLPDGSQLETFARLNCHPVIGSRTTCGRGKAPPSAPTAGRRTSTCTPPRSTTA